MKFPVQAIGFLVVYSMYMAIFIVFFDVKGSSLKGNIVRNYYSDFFHDGIVRAKKFPDVQATGMPRFIRDRYGDTALYWLADQLLTLSYNQNENSLRCINVTAECLFKSNNDYYSCPEPPFFKEIKHNFDRELNDYKLKKLSHMYLPEVFYFQHGLRFADQKILDYIKDKDFLDLGAFTGDSASVLADYTNKKIYSYEFSDKNYQQVIRYVKANSIENKVIVLNKGIDSVPSNQTVSNKEGIAAGVQKAKTGRVIEFTTIDKEVEDNNIDVGFMKADIEGFGYKALLGGLKTLEKHRPVFQFQVYHNIDEYFGIPQLLSMYPNYLFEFQIGSFKWWKQTFGEFGIFAYPAEILYPLYEQDLNSAGEKTKLFFQKNKHN